MDQERLKKILEDADIPHIVVISPDGDPTYGALPPSKEDLDDALERIKAATE